MISAKEKELFSMVCDIYSQHGVDTHGWMEYFLHGPVVDTSVRYNLPLWRSIMSAAQLVKMNATITKQEM